MYGYITKEYWNDIGDLKVYKEVNFDLLSRKVRTEIPYKQVQDRVWIGDDTIISEECS